jgi:predicted ABC-type ATPase
MPNFFLIAGPNGAGKSTSAPELLTGARLVAEFVNADVIARERNLSDMAAGRLTLERLTVLAGARKDLALETTLASKLLLPRIQQMQAAGYRFHMFFFWLPSADMAVRRVAARVASGGHSIPENVIRRRYERGLENFFNHYAPVADTWVLMNNAARPSVRIAWRDSRGVLSVRDNDVWNRLSARHMAPRAEEEKAIAYREEVWTAEDVEAAVNLAVTMALRRHKERGESVVMWRDGQVVSVKPEEIDV